MVQSILVTGGAGYIGTHTCVLLLEQGHLVTVFDNFCNSALPALERVAAIAGRAPDLVAGDLRDEAAVRRLFHSRHFAAVIHFAGLKAVGESVAQPLAYYENNVAGTLRLLAAMRETAVRTLVFSSSATVYGEPQTLPLAEDAPRSATSPYGRSKLMIEDILADLQAAEPDWRIARLRYFNPVGAHPSGLIGEDPRGIPNNLLPFVSQVASGRRPFLSVFGNDYPTPDGTGVRDYIHVLDLAAGHLAALRYLERHPEGSLLTLNLGTGRGVSVFEMLRAFEKACGRPIPFRLAGRRPGDVAAYYADPRRAETLLGWKAERGIEEMCRDTWCWQSRNPMGYAGE